MKKFLKLLTSMLMFVVLVISCGSKSDDAVAKAETESKGKVAIVFSTGGLGDKSFNDSANEGLKRAVNELGITYDYYEPKDPSAEAQNQLSNYAEKGDYDLIIAVGFSMKDSLVAVAKEFPDQKFALIDEVVEDMANVQSLMFKEQEGSYLVGALAAMMTKTNSIGFVGGIDVPVIQRFQSGYTQGAKAVNPDINIVSVFINGSNPFNDPVASKALTITMIDNQKVDIIFQAAGASGAGVFQAAKEKGVYAIGVDSDQDDVEKGVILTSMVKKVGNASFDAIKEVLNGNFQSGVRYFGLKEDGVDTTEFKYTKDIIGQDKIDKLKTLSDDIKSGKTEVKQYLK